MAALTAFLGLVSAVLALITTLLVNSNQDLSQQKQSAEADAATQASAAASLSAAASRQASALNALQGQIDGLDSSLSAAAASLSSAVSAVHARSSAVATPYDPSPTFHSLAGTVYRKGTVVVSYGSNDTHLDAPPSDPQWGRFSGGAGEIENANPGYLDPYGETAVERHATYASCIADTSLADVGNQQVTVGEDICMPSFDNRMAVLVVSAITSNATIWNITVYNTTAQDSA